MPLDRWYNATVGYAGAGVTIYAIDSGVRRDHTEFVDPVTLASKVTYGPNYQPDCPDAGDCCYGHGTFVASQAAGRYVGVAPQASVISIRIFSCSGASTTSYLLSAIDWAIADATAGGKKGIIHFSGGGGFSATVNTRVATATSSGLIFITSAGNTGGSACTRSPASAPSALTVGAVRSSYGSSADLYASFSSHGTCVDLSAVGDGNIGASLSTPTSYRSGSGTSFSAPLVTGVAAALWSSGALADARAVEAAVLSRATTGVIGWSLNPAAGTSGTPNMLLYQPPGGL